MRTSTSPRASVLRLEEDETVGAALTTVGEAVTAVGESMDALGTQLREPCPDEDS